MNDHMKQVLAFGLIMSGIFILLYVGKAHAEYTDEQIVNAIYKAEGGDHAEYPYGIRSVSCGTRDECRKICRNTVKNNRLRYAQYGKKSHPDFITFLASRYCPVGAGNDPKNLNKNWIKNVRYFLNEASNKTIAHSK